MILQPLDLSLLCFEHLLDQEHFSLLINKFVSVLLVLRTFNRDREPCCLAHVYLTLNLGVNCKGTWLDVSLANLAEASLPCGAVLLPDLEGLVSLLLLQLPFLLFLLEAKYLLVTRCAERIPLRTLIRC